MILKKTPNDAKYDAPSTSAKSESNKPFAGWEKGKASANCPCCREQKGVENFILAPDKATLSFKDHKGKRRTLFCSSCITEMANRFFLEDPSRSKYRALYRLCSVTDHYYDDKLAHHIIEENHTWEDGTPVSPNYPWQNLYLKVVTEDPALSTMTFHRSDNFGFESTLEKQYGEEESLNLLTENDKKNRRTILSIYHYDPFEDEPIKERSRMYEDLVTISDESMATDLVKARASIEIVRTFKRIDKINQALNSLEGTPEFMIEHSAEIKTLIEQKKKETDMVTSFSKDHGFSERYSSAKSKGSGTLSAIVRDMEEYGYDRGAVNLFDIETAAGMRQVAEISSQAIFKQLSFSSVEYADIVKEQGERIRGMQAVLEQQSEELRLLKEKHLKSDILEEYRQELVDKGIDPVEIDALVKQEIEYRPTNVGTSYYSADEIVEMAPDSAEGDSEEE